MPYRRKPIVLQRLHRNTRGFSLPEILVVLALVAILAAIAVPSMLNQRTKSVETGVRADLFKVSSSLDQLLNGWRGVPPAEVIVATANGTWTATPNQGEQVADGTVSEGTSVTGKIWTDGSYCVAATSSYIANKSYMYLSTTKVVTIGTCPNQALGGTGTITGADPADLPDMPANVAVTSPADNTVKVTWDPVTGATGYTLSLVGVSSVDVSTNSTEPNSSTLTHTFYDVQPGTASIVVYARSAAGSGAGATGSVNVTGTFKYALSTRLNAYTYTVANQTEKNALAGMTVGSTAYVADTAWIETYNGTGWVVTAGKFPWATTSVTSSKAIGSGVDYTFGSANGFVSDSFSMTISAGQVTVPRDGRYEVSFYVPLDGAASGGTRSAAVKVNNSTTFYVQGTAGQSSSSSILTGSRVLTLSADDVVKLILRQSSGNSLNIAATSSDVAFFDIQYLGPA